MTLASREVPVMVGLRLFLPETWTDDPERMTQAHVPKDRQIALTKPEIAIQEIDRVIASGVRFGCVLTIVGYARVGPWPTELRLRKDRKTLVVSFNDHSFELPAEFLRVRSQAPRCKAIRRPSAAPSPASAMWRSWNCIRSATTRCASCSTICIRPKFSVGTICSNSAKIASVIGASILMRSQPKVCREHLKQFK